jgi:O-antigen/teichoic acid export membrane protein
MKSQAYELGYAVGQLVGVLLAVGVLIYFIYFRKRKKNRTGTDQTLDL